MGILVLSIAFHKYLQGVVQASGGLMLVLKHI